MPNVSALTPCKRKIAEDDDPVDEEGEADTSISSNESKSNKRARMEASKPFQPAMCNTTVSRALADATILALGSNSLGNSGVTNQGVDMRNNILRHVISHSPSHTSAVTASRQRKRMSRSKSNTTSTTIPHLPVVRRESPPHPELPSNDPESEDDSDRKLPAVDRPVTNVTIHTGAPQNPPLQLQSLSTTSSTTSLPALAAQSQITEEETLGDVDAVDAVFRRMALLSFAVWFILVVGVYRLHCCRAPNDQDSAAADDDDALERRVPQTAFFILLVGNMLQVSPLMIQRIKTLAIGEISVIGNNNLSSPSTKLSGVMVAAIVIQLVAMATNALLGWGPRAVVLDPITGSRVFLWRWCEWIPLSGYMTLLAESTDVSTRPDAWRKPMIFALSQTLSTACGIILPYCQTTTQWLLVMTFSCLTFLPIFPRAQARREALLQAERGTTVLEREYYERRKFAYYLMVMCSIFWSVLVGLYFVNMTVHMTTSPGHWLRFASLAMSCDTIADVMAKVVYTRIIVDAHQAVFASDLRMVRQLGELKQLMSTLWVSSSDVIVISTKQTKYRKATMLSPSFLKLVGVNPPLMNNKTQYDDSSSTTSGSNETSRLSAALVLETDRGKVVSAYYVDTANMSANPNPTCLDPKRIIVSQKDFQENDVVQALRITNLTWTTRNGSGTDQDHQSEPLRAISIVHCDPRRVSNVMCEMKVSRHNQQTTVAVVRDVTERYRRFEAESRAHAETIARQRDMHKANRFTRHEVKNGLLSGIELCRTMGKSLKELLAMLSDQNSLTPDCLERVKSTLQQSASHINDKTLTSLVDLDGTLRGVLDTVLAEVMAREVVHGVYQPRLEELNVPSMLVSNLGMSKDRIPVIIKGGSMPELLLDAQLIGHIHRNAVSNALKYGKQGGTVQTYVEFDSEKREFRMEVANEPGEGHSALLALGESASEFVFAPGVRLQPHMKGKSEKKLDSSGDGAWIIQKCAKTMNGECDINFLADRTLFTFCCPAVPVASSRKQNYSLFTVPENVFGIGIDDSKIQRKLLSRILAHVGVEPSMQLLLGETHEDITEFETTLMNLMDEHPDKKFLVIVDEHLDYDNIALKQLDVVHSGSLMMKQLLEHMPKEYTDRLLVLMRSANDSAVDIAMYTQRTHGYFPKAIMQRDRTREILAPLWLQRFPEDAHMLPTNN